MTEEVYIQEAERLLKVVQEINLINGKKFKTKQSKIIKLAKSTNPLL